MLVVYGSVLRADQFASLFLNAWPFCPTLSGLRTALATIRERRAAAAAAEAERAAAQREEEGRAGGATPDEEPDSGGDAMSDD
jgi:hypothetical protein